MEYNAKVRLPSGFRSPCELAGAEPGTRVLLGLSGGSDSASLLDMLAKNNENLVLCHVNHGIRGAEADRDESFCRELSSKYGFEICVFNIDVPAVSKATGEGLEEAARRLRYECFESVMAEKGINILATAHNADDNAETLIFNLTRGASSKGGCGIPETRPLKDGRTVVRPILRVSKAEILNYCRDNSIEYVTDSTNSDTAYSRNRIRNLVIPELKSINPGFVSAVSGFCDSVSEDCRWLDAEAAKYHTAHSECLNASEMSELPTPIITRVLTLAARAAGASPERRHIDALKEAVLANTKISVTLPGSVIGTIDKKGRISFVFDKREKKIRPQNNDE